jgi:hypothetical protein
MFSRSDGVFLGGSHGEGVWSTDTYSLRAARAVQMLRNKHVETACKRRDNIPL